MFLQIIILFFASALRAADSTPQRLELGDVLKAVRERNPVIAAARAEARVDDQMALSAYAWMPPRLGVEFMGLDAKRPDLSNSMERRWSLLQELPFPGRTWGRGRVASYHAEAGMADAEMAERQELKAAKEAFYSLAAAEQLLKGLDRVSEATKEMARVSGRRAGFGQLDRMGQFMDTMLSMEDSQVDSMRPMAQQQKHAAELKLRRLMGADPFQALAPVQLDLDRFIETGPFDLKAALKNAENHSPEIRHQRAHLKYAQAAKTLALAGWLPDLMAQGTVTEDSMGLKQTDIMLGVTLPWLWFWKQSGEAGAANAALEKAEKDLEATRLAVSQQISEAAGEYKAAQEALRITWTRTYPKASKGLELARSGFRTTALGSSEILMAVQDYRMTEEKLAELIAQWGASRAMLEMLTSAPMGAHDEGAKP